MVGIDWGYSFSGLKCCWVDDDDFEKFDYILVMDNSNLKNLYGMLLSEYYYKIYLFFSFCESIEEEVFDFYYGGKGGFELVLDLIEYVLDGLIFYIKV